MGGLRPRAFEVVGWTLSDRLGSGEPRPALVAAVDDRHTPWEEVVRCADRNRVLPAFAAAMADVGLAGRLPDGLEYFLARVHAGNLRRNCAIRRQLLEVLTALNTAGIVPLLLKGAVRLIDDLYPDIGWRVLGDLDLLIPLERALDAVKCLHAVGYTPIGHVEPPPADTNCIALMARRAAAGVMIDLHHAPTVPAFLKVLPTAGLLSRADNVSLKGRRALVPAPDDQLVHLVMHRFIHHGGRFAPAVPLGDALEGWLLFRQLGDGAWEMCTSRLSSAGYPALSARWFRSVDTALGLQNAGTTADSISQLVGRWQTRLYQESQLARRLVRLFRTYANTAVILLGSSRSRQARFLCNLLTSSFYRRHFEQLVALWRTE